MPQNKECLPPQTETRVYQLGLVYVAIGPGLQVSVGIGKSKQPPTPDQPSYRIDPNAAGGNL